LLTLPAESSRGQCLIVGLGTMTGDLLKVLDVSAEDKVLFTTYGQLQPPLGIHRLKVNLYSNIYNVIICVINLNVAVEALFIYNSCRQYFASCPSLIDACSVPRTFVSFD
jgi:hypothetical protein